MNASDSNVDLELLAAFIDGRLSGDERARATRMLTTSDEALDLYAEVLRSRGGMPAAAAPIIHPAPRWRRWTTVVPLAAAAVLVGIVVTRSRITGPASDPAPQLVATLAHDGSLRSTLGTNWDQHGWPVTRGAVTSGEAVPSVAMETTASLPLAFRLGVRSVDLQLAIATGDRPAAVRATQSINDILKTVAFSETVATAYQKLGARLATDSLDRLQSAAARASTELATKADVGRFRLGEWAAAAEAAARSGDTAFSASTQSTQFLASSVKANGLSADQSRMLQQLAARAAADRGDATLKVLQDSLRAIGERPPR